MPSSQAELGDSRHNRDSRMRINLRRGLLRLWIVMSALWVITVAALSFGAVHDEFAKAQSMSNLYPTSWEPYANLIT